LVRLPGS